MSVLAGKLEAWSSDCAPVAGKSTLNRLELSRDTPTKYRKIAHEATKIEGLFVDLFLEAHAKAPKQITLDLDATDDPLHGDLGQMPSFALGRAGFSTPTTIATAICHFMCSAADICWRPSSDRQTSTGVRARRRRSRGSSRKSGRVGRACAFCFRGDSGFCREELMSWCEVNRVDFLFGLARNPRLVGQIDAELTQAEAEARRTSKCARRFKDFSYSTLESWSRRRRWSARRNGPTAKPIRGSSSPR
jgi:hypothetical protein